MRGKLSPCSSWMCRWSPSWIWRTVASQRGSLGSRRSSSWAFSSGCSAFHSRPRSAGGASSSLPNAAQPDAGRTGEPGAGEWARGEGGRGKAYREGFGMTSLASQRTGATS
jgi:hypothetical protein